MKYRFYKSALYLAVGKENIEIVKLLLANEKINVNLAFIFKKLFFYKIENYIFQFNSKLFIFITFKIISLNRI